MRYRPEIDGLRAVAVVPVILFHAGFRSVGGGFVGVDVFFVISGFLITSILLEEHATGGFSVRGFYERRARRILPALYVVLCVCVPLSWLLMMPDELADFFRGLLAVVFFVSNIWLWQATGYFQPAAEENPLLHTWSLGVEEQYYLLFPLLLILLWRRGPRALLWGVGALSVGSLALAEYGWRHWPEANFYLLPTRFWELGAGSLVAVVVFRRARPPVPGVVAEVATALGIAAIVGSVLLFDASTPIPSLWALLPVAGAAAIVGCGAGTVAGRLLALAPLRMVGLISYSAYLWHQPLFAFARIGLEEAPGRKEMLVLTLLTFGLAYLTWRFVEQPFRDPARLRTPLRLVWASGAIAAGALILPAATYQAAADPSLPGQELLVSLDERSAYVLAPYEAQRDRGFTGPAGAPKVLILGDSHALDFWNMAREVDAFADDQLALAYVFTECQVALGGPEVRALQAPATREDCAGWKGAGHTVDLAREADVVIIVASWRPWAVERLPQTLAAYRFRPDQKVLVAGRKSFKGVNLRRLVGADPDRLAAVRAEQRGSFRTTTETMRRTLPAGTFLDLHAIACGAGWHCPVFTPEGRLISHDGSHLTRAGARWLGDRVFSDPRLAGFRPQVQAALYRPTVR